MYQAPNLRYLFFQFPLTPQHLALQDKVDSTASMAQSDGAEKQDDVNGIKPERPVDLECPGASTVMPSVRSTLEWIRQQARARPSCRTQVPPRANEGCK